MKIKKKIFTIVMLIITLITSFSNTIFAATKAEESTIVTKGRCEMHLQYYKESQGIWSYITGVYVVYKENGKEYPAYCLNPDLPGVGLAEGDYSEYDVDISKDLDERIWRVVSNGFPYKTPQEMGLYDEYDAFLVTKQAVYSILNNYDAEKRYRGADERGTAMANAIVKLVDIGRNGTQKQFSGQVTTSKVGNLVEEENYYSQEYKVNTSVEISGYEIVSTSGLPEGAIITDVNGNKAQNFNGSNNFKIKIPKEQMNKNINVSIKIKAQCKTYPVFYGKTRIANTQNYAVAYEKFEDILGTADLQIAVNTGKLIIIKTDEETLKPINGVTFQVLNENGIEVAKQTTNEKGEAVFTGLVQGLYKVKEIKANEEYNLNDKIFDANIKYNKTTQINITNSHKKGNLIITKVDKDDNQIKLEGVEFELYSEELGKIIGIYTTDKNGEIKLENLRTGKYKLIEKKTNEGYNLDTEERQIQITADETCEITIENELKKGQIKVIKIDKDNNQVKLQGVKFDVLDENENILETIITDENGEAITKNYAIRDYSKLKLREKETQEMYVLNEETQEVVLEENQIKNIVFENEKIKGKIEIFKLSEDYNQILKTPAGTPIKDVVFEIYNSENQLVQEIKTNAQGLAITKDLEKGTYKVREKASGEFYLLNTKEYKAEIKENNEIVKLKIKNKSENPKVSIEKQGPEQAEKNQEIEYKFNIKNTGNTYLDNFTWYEYLPTDYVRISGFVTGTYNQELNYNLYYKTNKNDFRLFQENLNSKESKFIDFSEISLEDDEYITEIKTEFGRVEKGFSSSITPYLYAKVNEDSQAKDIIVNKTKVSSTFKGYNVTDEDKMQTVIFEEVVKKLPKTGF
ncbi:MAG: Cys-Gln thioester bond-forming surface protein [Clostridia bacterium]|nr:Cys-Gln thioester bond-forming surface protein [Clostridia bacterium]